MILETFITNKVYNNYTDNVENDKYSNSFLNYCTDLCSNQSTYPHLIIAIILALITSIVAGILAWRCNAKEKLVFKCINTILAVLFSDIYVLYYLIYRVILKHRC